ncbi:MAG: DUF2723 domain-containing protein [Bacteroidaceae bacterium]|nr:DUF2723 domain-containing protein [Bacteroidaceae bacterium]
MKRYQAINNIFGWLTFLIAAITYCMTVEPTASFWDCPEFILSGNKLEVGHPPGAPFFMLTANLFSSFASPDKVALMVNIMSAVLSAAGIMFLFWSITHLTRKLIVSKNETITTAQIITIIGSGVVGALAYTWSDTYWFSAVEGEVYGYSSLFTAVVFWLILKWEEYADEPRSDRWLILIAYLIGLSIGVHLLNLLCIPAIVLVVYFKRKPNATIKGSITALILSMILVAVVLYGIVPGVVKVGGWFELLFVNSLGLPFNTGLIIYLILLFGALVWGLYESEQGKNRRNLAISFIASVALLGIPFYGYGALSIVIGVIVLAVLAYLLFYKKEEKYILNLRILNTSLLCLLVIMVGYSSYALIVIRSSANTPMDQNSPEDIFTLGEYLGREQYGTRPLFYGQAYSSEVEFKQEGDYLRPVVIDGAPRYAPKEKSTPDEKDSYELLGYKSELSYAQNMLFPRMYSKEHSQYGANKVNLYEDWVGKIKGRNVRYNRGGEIINVVMPTQWENLKFFINYQLNHMYWRYFMWNFVGRQNDLQSHGELDKGNWITGISFIDNLLVGNQEKLPTVLKNNKGRNVFYALPLILGILGMVWQYKKGQTGIQQFWIVFFLFFMTGLAIVLYLNQTPLQPRERDYAYAGSFYAFAIWIGMGVAAITEMFKRRSATISTAVTIVSLLVPIQMVSQTWDDHDRSNRYACRDFGQNYLNSMPEEGNPIIFTCGDNDTFPLWYNQEVEGVRTDSRVCNLSYLQTDWYIDQMRRPAYDSPSIPITWERINYAGNNNEAVEVIPEFKDKVLELYRQHPEESKKRWGENPFEVQNIMKYWVCSKDPRFHFIPTDTVYIKIDKEAVIRSGMVIPEEYRDSMPEYMKISLGGRTRLYRGQDLMLLEMIAQTNWERPLYMSMTVGRSNYLSTISDFFVQEGLAYRITPFNWKELGYSGDYDDFVTDTDKLYHNVMERFKFGGIKENPDYYMDETINRMALTHRRLFSSLAMQLLTEGEKEKALKVLDRAEEELPSSLIPHEYFSGIEMGRAYMILGEKEKACDILGSMADESIEYLTWYNTLNKRRFASSMNEIYMRTRILQDIIRTLENGGEEYRDITEKYINEFAAQYELMRNKG